MDRSTRVQLRYDYRERKEVVRCLRIKPGVQEVLADPLLMEVLKGDYRMKEGSPCRAFVRSAPEKGR